MGVVVKYGVLQRLVGYSATSICVCLVIYKFLGTAMHPLRVAYIFDPRLSYHVRHHIEHVVSPLVIKSGIKTSFDDLFERQWPSVTNVTSRLLASRTALITVSSSLPRVGVNSLLILTQDGKLVSANQFEDAVMSALPQIIVDDQRIIRDGVSKDLFTFIKNLPSDVLMTYAIKWIDKTRIELIHPLYPDVHVIAWYKTCFTQRLHDDLIAIHAILEAKGKEIKRKNIAWQVDVRIDRQIILARV